MADISSMHRNSAALARCEKIYKYVFLANVGIAADLVFASLYSMLGDLVSGEWVVMLGYFVSMILCTGACALTVMGGYTKKDIVVWAAPGAAGLSVLSDRAIIGYTTLNTCLALFVAIISVAPTLLANAKYRWLETQEGFPHFSELLQEQQDKAKEFNEHDPYEEAARQRKFTQSDAMSDVVLPAEKLEEKPDHHSDLMDSI